MSHHPLWVSIIQWALVLGLLAGAMGWISRARMKPATASGETIMTYPRSVLVLALFCVVISGGLVSLIFIVPARNAPFWAMVPLVVSALASLHWLADSWIARYRLSEEGFRYVSLYRGERLFRWNDLQRLKYAPNLRWFVLRNSQGQVARISIMMTGLPMFARLLMERARNVNIDAAAVPILKRAASGEPPSLWD
jgi:hypothetical protein